MFVCYRASDIFMHGHGVIKTCVVISRGMKSRSTINSVTPTHSLHIRSVDLYSYYNLDE